jgi:hypothetical protein
MAFLLLLTNFETFCRETEQINDHYHRAFSWVDQQFLTDSLTHMHAQAQAENHVIIQSLRIPDSVQLDL